MFRSQKWGRTDFCYSAVYLWSLQVHWSIMACIQRRQVTWLCSWATEHRITQSSATLRIEYWWSHDPWRRIVQKLPPGSDWIVSPHWNQLDDAGLMGIGNGRKTWHISPNKYLWITGWHRHLSLYSIRWTPTPEFPRPSMVSPRKVCSHLKIAVTVDKALGLPKSHGRGLWRFIYYHHSETNQRLFLLCVGRHYYIVLCNTLLQKRRRFC